MAASVIYKYPFEISDEVRLDMPIDAKILCVEVQAGVPMMWALVNPRAVNTTRRFRVIGTGHLFDTSYLVYVTTFQQPPFVWHVFEEQP
jgi:hypothetical protein